MRNPEEGKKNVRNEKKKKKKDPIDFFQMGPKLAKVSRTAHSRRKIPVGGDQDLANPKPREQRGAPR